VSQRPNFTVVNRPCSRLFLGIALDRRLTGAMLHRFELPHRTPADLIERSSHLAIRSLSHEAARSALWVESRRLAFRRLWDRLNGRRHGSD
jgi:hypothetical protein